VVDGVASSKPPLNPPPRTESHPPDSKSDDSKK
jgi:hypothetical protein